MSVITSSSNQFFNPPNPLVSHVAMIQNIPNPDQVQYMTYTHSIAWTFNKENKLIPDKTDILYTPGPSKYNPNDSTLTTRAPAWKISETVYKQKQENFPGPGSNEYKTFIGEEGPKYTMSPNYDIDGKTIKNSNKINSNKVPGPGSYDPTDIEETHSPKYTISKTGASKKKRIQSAKTPAVGDYNLRNDKDLNECGFHFDKEKRTNLNLNKTALNYPGPNKYNIDYNNLSSHGPKWTFSRTERLIPKKSNKNKKKARPNTPGPGSYKMRTYMGKEGPQFSFGKEKLNHADAVDETLFKLQSNFPDMCSYQKDIRYKVSTPIYSIPKSKRPASSKLLKSELGPGKYDPNKEFSSTLTKMPNWTLYNKNATKSKIPIDNKTPGPGTYTINQGKFPEGPKYTFPLKRKDPKPEQKPGPGQYDHMKFKLHQEPFCFFGRETRGDELKIVKKNNYPGPDKYEIRDQYHCKNLTFPKSGSGRAKSAKGKVSDGKRKTEKGTPGPGAYRIPTAFDYISNMSREKGIWDPTFRYV